MPMTELSIERFKKMPLALKYKLVEEKGQYITRRRHLTYHIELFQLNTFYVEVWRSIATNQIYWIECPAKDYVHDKYLQHISLSGLI